MIYKTDSNIYDTGLAVDYYCEDSYWDGQNNISVNTGSQWEHQQLYLSSKGNWYVVASSQWQGSRMVARDLTPEEAAEWLVLNNKELPKSLASLNPAQ